MNVFFKSLTLKLYFIWYRYINNCVTCIEKIEEKNDNLHSHFLSYILTYMKEIFSIIFFN